MKIIVELYILICDDCKKEFTIKKKNIKSLKELKGKLLRKELTVEEYERNHKEIINKNNSLNGRYKVLNGR
ncbi:hypothetical protein [uncultured Clostridium sp.]|uniref:hypothetical protein n=1 Tax=uncultured Clostridium sp. TaxID=59620 RepID=UPI0025DCB92F|nr:hypothetical protein [uncultured Clostridium sp.]